jgi:hypothetical protein
MDGELAEVPQVAVAEAMDFKFSVFWLWVAVDEADAFPG